MSERRPLRPVVVFTVHRRYFELGRALENLRGQAGVFARPPAAVVVWACPEVGRLWFFQKLLREGLVDHVLTRMPLEGEGPGRPTTYPESVNIRLGLEYARERYGPDDAYAILHTADVLPRPGRAFPRVEQEMQAGAGAVVFWWPNGMVRDHIWHTNFFAARLDEAYWPPVSERDAGDVLEWQWGKRLMRERPPGVVQDTNTNQYWFLHEHLSEGQPPWPVEPQSGGASAGLAVSGCEPWYRRLMFWRRRRAV